MAVENMAAARGEASAVAAERCSEGHSEDGRVESMCTARARCHSSAVRYSSLWRVRVRNAAAISLAAVALSCSRARDLTKVREGTMMRRRVNVSEVRGAERLRQVDVVSWRSWRERHCG